MNEAGILAIEGNNLETIDNALLDFGMPMGPFRLMDEVGLDVSAHVAKSLRDALGKRFSGPPEADKLLEVDNNYLGKKTGQGIYMYDGTGIKAKAKGLSPMAIGKIKTLVKNPKPSSKQDIVDRCILIALQEAAYILDEGIVSCPEDLDLAMIMGTGFAPFRGGLLNYADQRGLEDIVNKLKSLEKVDAKFKPHPYLVKMVENKQKFFPSRPQITKPSKKSKL
jgi:3-hydroxyacyl-CoA dehydrogenase/enoyl-CoA hydratase/3-hydroxybutyryl-CoA epimerase